MKLRLIINFVQTVSTLDTFLECVEFRPFEWGRCKKAQTSCDDVKTS